MEDAAAARPLGSTQQGGHAIGQGAAQLSQAVRATELVDALRQVGALEHELLLARQAAHRLEVDQQGARARALVEMESLAAQLEQLRARLDAAEASSAARQQVAELWQRKHAEAEGRAVELEASLQQEREGRVMLEETLLLSQQQALQAQAEASAFRKATSATLRDLSELCSALQTAQAAMAVDSSSRPEYRSALSLMEASLQRVVAASEGAMSAVMASAASLPGPCSKGRPQSRETSPVTGLLSPQLQRQVQGLLRHPGRAAMPVPQLTDKTAAWQAASHLAGAGWEKTQGATAGGLRVGGTTRAESTYTSRASTPIAAGAGASQALVQLQHSGPTSHERGRDQGEQCQEPAPPHAAAKGPQPSLQQRRQCSPPASATKAVGKSAQGSPGASSGQQPSAFLLSFRAQYGRGVDRPGFRPADSSTDAENLTPAIGSESGMAAGECVGSADTASEHGPEVVATAAAGELQAHSSSPPLAAAGGDSSSTPCPRAPPQQRIVPERKPGSGLVAPAPAPGAGVMVLAQPPGKPLTGSGAAAPANFGLLHASDSLTAVIMGVEDELAMLDLRHAALLEQSRKLAEVKALPGDTTAELERERVAGVIRSVREAMQRKGEQLRQLQQYRDAVAAG